MTAAKGPEGATAYARLRAWWRRWFSPSKGGLDIGAVATRHLFRGHRGEALLCRECVEDSR